MLSTLLFASLASAACTLPAAGTTRYLITFGDSYSQTGFNVSTGPYPSAANPLGNPALPGYTASGGLDWVGFAVTKNNASQLFSYNLAYGGATTDAALVTPYAPTVLSFKDQVKEFTDYLAKKPSYAPWTAETALVGVWIGVNDVGNTFYLSNVNNITNAVVTEYFQLLQTVYDAGVRNFVLLSVPPTDKSPLMLANPASSEDQLRSTISLYNSLLTSKLSDFKTKNAGVNSWLVDTSIPFNTALNNPKAYGAPDATCYNADGKSCLWFNDYHPGINIQGLVSNEVAKTVGAPWFKTV